MEKVYLICGKICSGKTYFASQLAERLQAVQLSVDHIMLTAGLDCIENAHAVLVPKIEHYLHQIASALAQCEIPSITDFGYWTAQKRAQVQEFFHAAQIPMQWIYMDCDARTWARNIRLRNQAVASGTEQAYYVDAGLRSKIEEQFQPPARFEVDIVVTDPSQTDKLPHKRDSRKPGDVVLLCGKIASGKSYYAEALLQDGHTVLLSQDDFVDQLGLDYFDDLHSSLIPKLQDCLYELAADISRCGANVVLDFGFWNKRERQYVSEVFRNMRITPHWCYIDVSDEAWAQNIADRNREVIAAGCAEFQIDAAKMQEINAEFEVPARDEMDIWMTNTR